MARRVSAHMILGMALSGLGTFALSVGLARAEMIPDVFGLDGWVVATMEGFILLLSGILVIIFVALRPVPQVAPVVSATAAFASRSQQEMPRPATRTQPVTVAAQPKRAMHPNDLALFRLDEEIRDLTRRINKAGVLLATGQLSDDGYAHYVEDLKRQRGQLEASRVRLELARKRA